MLFVHIIVFILLTFFYSMWKRTSYVDIAIKMVLLTCLVVVSGAILNDLGYIVKIK